MYQRSVINQRILSHTEDILHIEIFNASFEDECLSMTRLLSLWKTKIKKALSKRL